MRAYIFIVFFLFANVQTSYIDDFRHAMRHVENGFKKLLSDIENDMRETIHCTISAMEQVLIINGILDKPSGYNKKCLGDIHPSTFNVKDAEQRRQIESNVYNKSPTSTYNAGDSHLKNIYSQEVHNSISNVNKHLNNLLLKRGRGNKTENIPEIFRDEMERLSEVSNLLRKELEKISNNIKNELENMNFDQKSPEVIVWNEIQILHKVENESNSSQANEIHHVVESALNILKSNDNSSLKGNSNGLEKIIKELENTDGNESSKSLQDYKKKKEHDAKEITKDFKQISNEDNKYIKIERKERNTNNHDSKSSIYASSFFNSFGKVSGEKDAIEDAMSMVKDSEFANLLFKDQNIGNDVFGHGGLFNF